MVSVSIVSIAAARRGLPWNVVVVFHSTGPAMEASFIHRIPVSVVASVSCRMSSRLLNGNNPAAFLRQLHPGLCVTVEHGEVGHDNWHWKGDHQNTREGTEGADYDPSVGLGNHVTIAHCGHRHHCPP